MFEYESGHLSALTISMVGVVFIRGRSDQATKVTLKLRLVFDPAASSQRAAEYLGNFKRVAENGN